MRVLILHNEYQNYGGEDAVFNLERKILSENNIDINYLLFSNHSITTLNDKIQTSISIKKNVKNLEIIKIELKQGNYDIIHCHNFFPLISPGLHLLAKEMNIPIVQTIHNYRLFCSNGFFWKKNSKCQKCLNNNYWGVFHKCYKNSSIGSYIVKKFQDASIKNKYWIDSVTLFFVLSNYAKNIFIQNGIPKDKLYVKPNFIDNINKPTYSFNEKQEFLYVGRLDSTKGILELAEMIRSNNDLSLKIIGSGPLKNEIENMQCHNLSIAGHISDQKILKDEYSKAKALIFSSKSHESQPMTIVEAMSIGLPIISFNNPSIKEMFGQDYPNELFYSNENELLKSINFLKDIKNLKKTSNYLIDRFKVFNKSMGIKNLISGYNQAININKIK